MKRNKEQTKPRVKQFGTKNTIKSLSLSQLFCKLLGDSNFFLTRFNSPEKLKAKRAADLATLMKYIFQGLFSLAMGRTKFSSEWTQWQS